MGRALNCTLTREVPVGNGLCTSLCLGVVMRQQCGLHLGHFWELRFEHLRNACMVLLPRTPHEGVIRHLLGEDMLEGVHWSTEGVGLVEKLGGLQAPEITVYGLLRYVRHR